MIKRTLYNLGKEKENKEKIDKQIQVLRVTKRKCSKEIRKHEQTIADLVINYICRVYNVSDSYFYSDIKTKDIYTVRHICRYILNKKFFINKKKISELTGYIDHTTVINSINVVEDDIELKNRCEELYSLFMNNGKVKKKVMNYKTGKVEYVNV